MEWIEWLFSREFQQFVLEHGLFVPLLLLARIFFITGLELVTPARKVDYRAVLPYDLMGWILVIYILVPVSQYLSNLVAIQMRMPDLIIRLPFPVLFLLYYIIGDFGEYWMHRFMHSKHLWRVHKWHHSPTTMYWLAGYRTSLPQQVLFNLPWIFAYSVFVYYPWWLFLALLVSQQLINDWMHMNVSWRTRKLEWLIVTPRYHHVHHSDNPEHYNMNFGATFSVWDRIFGTFYDPDRLKKPVNFGIGEQVPLVRLVSGI